MDGWILEEFVESFESFFILVISSSRSLFCIDTSLSSSFVILVLFVEELASYITRENIIDVKTILN